MQKHWRCLTLIGQPTKKSEHLIYHLWGRLGWQSLILHLFIFPILPFSYYLLSRWRSHCPSIRWTRCLSSSPRGRPPTTSTTASCRCSSSSYSPSCWLRRTLSRWCGCWCWRSRFSSSNHLRKRVKMVRYQFVSPRYQLDLSNSTKEERKNGIFLKSYSLSKKSKGVPLLFLKTLLDLFLCDETNEPNALIPSLSRSKPGCDWHPHLPSYVSEPTNLNLNISM